MPNFWANLKECGVQALMVAALILAGHWLRHRQLDAMDILPAVGVWILYLVCAAQLTRYRRAKASKPD